DRSAHLHYPACEYNARCRGAFTALTRPTLHDGGTARAPRGLPGLPAGRLGNCKPAHSVLAYDPASQSWIRHMAGKYFEQLERGQVFEHEIRRTVTEAENIWFCGATYNPAQIHIDAEYCKQTEFGRPLFNSIFTLGLVIGLTVQDTTLGTTVA